MIFILTNYSTIKFKLPTCISTIGAYGYPNIGIVTNQTTGRTLQNRINMFPLLCDYIGFSLSEYDVFLSSDKTAPQLFMFLPLTKLMSCLCLADCFFNLCQVFLYVFLFCFPWTATRPYMFRYSSIGPDSNLIAMSINLCGQLIWPLHFDEPVQLNLHFCIISVYVKRSLQPLQQEVTLRVIL